MRVLLGVAVVVVRVYDFAGIADVDRRAALDVAEELLADTNAHVIFRDCPTDVNHPSPCSTALGPGERMVRIMNAPPDAQRGKTTSLGNAAVDDRTNEGVLATMYADHVAQKAPRQPDQNLLLGRTIAHELGHLLLGVKGHSRTGLMRKYWTERELGRNDVRDWRFSVEDRSRICTNLLGAGNCWRINASAKPASSPGPPTAARPRVGGQ